MFKGFSLCKCENLPKRLQAEKENRHMLRRSRWQRVYFRDTHNNKKRKKSLYTKHFFLNLTCRDWTVCFSLPIALCFSHTHSHVQPQGSASLYVVGSIRRISWWWKVVLMWCLQSSTGETDIWSSLWPSLTLGLLSDLISLLLGPKVGRFVLPFLFFPPFRPMSPLVPGGVRKRRQCSCSVNIESI